MPLVERLHNTGMDLLILAHYSPCLLYTSQTPLKAHSAGKGALIGVIVWTALSIILAILAYVIPLLVFYSYY